MAGQIKDWVYKKVDWAYSTGSWEWTVNVATTAELFKYFSSTTIFRDSANVYDNKHYGLVSKYDGLMIRPITGNNGYTGVCHFHLYNENDRYYSDLEGLYGEFTLRDLVLMVFKACGLMVDEDHRTYWLNQVLSLMITLPAERSWVCNTSIRRAGGYQVAAYVDKSIVDDIISCMQVKGMFNFQKEMIEEIEDGASYEFTGSGTARHELEFIFDTITDTTSNSMARFQANLSTIGQGSVNNICSLTFASLDAYLQAWETAQDFSLEDDYCVYMQARWSMQTAAHPILNIIVQCVKFVNDTYIGTGNYTKVDYNVDDATHYTQGSSITLNTNLANISESHTFVIQAEEVSGTPTWTGYTIGTGGGFTEVYTYVDVYTGTRTTSYFYIYDNNFATEGSVGPEGVTIIEGADAPDNNTSSSNFWPSWAGRAVTVSAYSGSNHPSYTYIPVGYGDYDYEEFTQARVQSGWIFNNTWLQRLGLTMELMEEYDPVEPDPDDPEPIRPDPDPTPEPTPPDPGILDISASRLFTVHQLSNAEVDNLGSFIYSQTFIDAIKNMFMEPMDAIIGCFILNYGSGGTLPLGSNETLKLGSVLGATGVTGTKVTNQTFECSFGTKDIGEFYHNVLDYAPYTSVQIYLPYIGFVDLDTNEVMNSRITLKYRFDVFTGMCLARLFVNRNGVTHELYNFEGNSAVHIPLTGRDFTNAIAPMLSGAVGLIGGAATGNPVAMALGAKNMIGNSANVKRSGSLSSNTGVLGQQTPFILVNRPKAYNAASYNSYYGYPSNWTVTLSSCSGYTRCKDVHLDALSCSDQEREEIEALLCEGVIF